MRMYLNNGKEVIIPELSVYHTSGILIRHDLEFMVGQDTIRFSHLSEKLLSAKEVLIQFENIFA